MDDKSLQLYKEALQDGKEKVYNIRVMVVGQYGVGKTTLTKRLLGQQVDISERKITEGIDVYKHCCKIALDTGEWIVQHEDSDQLSRLQRLVKLLTQHTQRPEVSDELGGQTEVIYQRETTEDLHGPVHYSDSDDNDDDDDVDDDDDDDEDILASSSESDFEQEADNTKNQPGESSSFKVDLRPPAKDSSGVNIQEDERRVTSDVDATMEFLQLVVENSDKLQKSIVEYATLAMWDFAGQHIFYTTHQTFLTCRAIYLLVANLGQQVTDLVEDDECYFDAEGVKLCHVQDLVEVWLNSIHCYAQSSALGKYPKPDNTVTTPAVDTVKTSHGVSTQVQSLDVGIPVTPPVILVGTHVDKIRQDKRQEVINKFFQQICRTLNENPSLQHLVGFIAIDNTQSDPQLETLKKQIFQLASAQQYWGEELPANWLPLEEALMKLKASGNKVIPHILVEEMNQAGAVPIKTTEQLDLFLRFQHETGNILYFGVEGLKEWIVLDPKWLIDALKSLITAEAFVLNNNPAVRRKWFEFKDSGKLSAQLIDAIWTKEGHPEFHDNKDTIVQFMEKLNIVARPRLYSPDSEEAKVDDYFLAPCMLRQAPPEQFISLTPNSQQGGTSVLCFTFTAKFLPTPVFHRLLAVCVAHWPIARQNLDKLIFCGCCLFDLDLHHRLTMLFREYGIFVRVTRMGSNETTPSSKLCIEVREFIAVTLCTIIGCLGQSLPFELSIQCPKSDRYSVDCLIPVTSLQRNVDVPCHFHESSHLVMSHDVLKFWFQEEDKEDSQQQQPYEQGTSSSSEENQEDEGPDDADTPITEEHINHARLCNALTTVCANALREVLSSQVPMSYADISQAILANHANLTSRKQIRPGQWQNALLNKEQIKLVFPDPQGRFTGALDQFDISLLYTLIRNVSSVQAPATLWGNPPVDQPRDTGLGASVERIRLYRNNISGHSVDGKISQQEFDDYWNKLTDVLHDIENVIGSRGYREELEKRKNQIITQHEARELEKTFKEYKKQVNVRVGDIQSVLDTLQTVVDRTAEVLIGCKKP